MSRTVTPRGHTSTDSAALVQLRAYLARSDLTAGARLPPERQLCVALGVSRGDLRKALAVLESEGQLWRHVGKGTFIGGRTQPGYPSLADLERRTSPVDVMRTRLLLEPQIAGEAAVHATRIDVDALQRACVACQRARTWREYETADNLFHRLLAVSTQNYLLLSMFDVLNAVRRTVTWGRERSHAGAPPRDHHSFREHEAIVTAIASADAAAATRAMQAHLSAVQEKLLAIAGNAAPGNEGTRSSGVGG